MMLQKIVDALQGRRELKGWSVRQTVTREAQVYLVGKGMESQRLVDEESYRIEVFRETTGPDGKSGMGAGEVTMLADGDIQASIEKASLVAGLVCNPVYNLPAPAALPDVPLVDEELKKNPLGKLTQVTEELLASAAGLGDIRMTSAEGFAKLDTIHFVNSRGLDVQQEMTNYDVEFVLQGRHGEREMETLREFSCRRAADLRLAAELEHNARFTRDMLQAGPPPQWEGPVVMRDNLLVVFVAGDSLAGGVLQSLGAAGSKYAKASTWEVGQSVFHGEVTGDPFTAWANRTIPYGVSSNRFDGEGLPAQRVELIRENKLVTFSASQKYADYLNLKPTGAFGNLEVAPGKWESAALLEEPYVEIALFSWFNPDHITGDFASEIRLGYVVENGVRKPFRGGLLVGNVLDALANVRWGKETTALGHYLGPTTARFGKLKVAGE